MNTSWWYDWGGLNRSLFLQINHAGSGWVWDHLALLGTALGDHMLYPLYAALALALALKRPNLLSSQAVLAFLAAYLVDWVLIAALKPLLDFPRPARVLGDAAVHILGQPEYAHSFPSGHTAFAVLLAASLLPGAHWALKVLLLLFALWVAWARIAVGAHFPADVLGGALIGGISAWIATRGLGLAGYGRGRR
jgi:undecaprenyl-diphosphatase